eukprot:14954723-Alexandrium_andersonii.AAC.1
MVIRTLRRIHAQATSKFRGWLFKLFEISEFAVQATPRKHLRHARRAESLWGAMLRPFRGSR